MSKTKKRTKRLPEDKKVEVAEKPQEEQHGDGDGRPRHLAAAVVASYQTRTGHVIGAKFPIIEGETTHDGEIAGGSVYGPRATCINGDAKRSRWRVQCYTGFVARVDGDMLRRYLPKPTAVVWVDETGWITEVC